MPAANLDILISNSQGDDEFVREIVAMAVEQVKEQIAELRTLCTSGENPEWVAAAHALKGSAATIGAEEMRLLCAFAQKELHDADASVRKAKLDEIEAAYHDARQSLIDQKFLAA